MARLEQGNCKPNSPLEGEVKIVLRFCKRDSGRCELLRISEREKDLKYV